MERHDAWNHTNYCVPPEHVPRLCEAIEALFPCNLNRGALYLRPTPAARTLYAVLAALRREHAELDTALGDNEIAMTRLPLLFGFDVEKELLEALPWGVSRPREGQDGAPEE